MWEYYGLKSEPWLSIGPLTEKETLRYFVERKEEKDLSRFLYGTIPKKLIVSGSAGVGKTSLVCKVGIDLSSFIRVDISRLEEVSGVIDRIALSIAHTAIELGIKEAINIERDILYSYRESHSTTKSIEGKIPTITGEYSQIRGISRESRESTFSRTRQIDTLLREIKRKKGMPIVFLDDADHLPEELQGNILVSCESIISSSDCICVFATRKSVHELFFTDISSRYRSRFDDSLLLTPGFSTDPKIVHSIFEKRLMEVATPNFKYPFTKDCEEFLSSITEGNIKELLRYGRVLLEEGEKKKASIPINSDMAMDFLSKRGYLIAEIDYKDYRILKYLSKERESASNKDFQDYVELKRNTLSQYLNYLVSKGFLTKETLGKKIIYGLTPKGKSGIEVYEKIRKVRVE